MGNNEYDDRPENEEYYYVGSHIYGRYIVMKFIDDIVCVCVWEPSELTLLYHNINTIMND